MYEDVLLLARPEDHVFMFYTDMSVRVSFKDLHPLIDKCLDVQLVRCNRTGNNSDNALDFQLVSELGYQIARNAAKGICEIYFLVSCDGGFDAVVSYWRSRNILIQRLAPAQNAKQNLPRGPMTSIPGGATPVAIRPAFAEISKVAKRFRSLLQGTEYATWEYRIAESFVRLLHLHESGSNDKFVLAFRNEMTGMFGSGNSVYQRLKPAFAAAKIIAMDAQGRDSITDKAGSNTAELIEKSEKALDRAAEQAAAPAPLIKASGDAATPDQTQAQPMFQIIPDAELQKIFAIHNVSNTLKMQLSNKLQGNLKSEAKNIMGLMASSYDADINVWNRRYLRLLRSRYDVTNMPPLAKVITLSYWPNVTKTAIAAALKRLDV